MRQEFYRISYVIIMTSRGFKMKNHLFSLPLTVLAFRADITSMVDWALKPYFLPILFPLSLATNKTLRKTNSYYAHWKALLYIERLRGGRCLELRISKTIVRAAAGTITAATPATTKKKTRLKMSSSLLCCLVIIQLYYSQVDLRSWNRRPRKGEGFTSIP